MATKVKAEEKAEPKADEKEVNPLLDATRKVLLAGIGAFALAQEEIEDFIGKLVERGEIAEQDGKKLIREVVDKRKKTTKDAEEEANKRIQDILDRLNVPTKSDIDSLGEKIAVLTKRVEDLKKGQG
jgi:poly(hydroxyalkanoate) granule-associated protein